MPKGYPNINIEGKINFDLAEFLQPVLAAYDGYFLPSRQYVWAA